ncbi:MAG: hypothetical protein RLZZ268_1556 [Cyanobacteriota bacterium]|jgi:predicted RNA-binding protein (virulence factor B family)
MHFWAPEIDPSHPMDCTQAERYALKSLNNGTFLAIAGEEQNLVDVGSTSEAFLFHTHEAALRAATNLNRVGRGPLDVVKIEWEPA